MAKKKAAKKATKKTAKKATKKKATKKASKKQFFQYCLSTLKPTLQNVGFFMSELLFFRGEIAENKKGALAELPSTA